MINIITIKWGTKYSSDYPNRIYKECLEKCSFDFTFYCITDDPNGLDDNIIDLPMPTHSNLNYNNFIQDHLDYKTQMWDRPKLYLFNDFDFQGTNIFMDLDAQVNKDLVYLTTLPKDKPWLVDMWWHKDYMENWDKFWGTRCNTSVMVWQDNQCQTVYDKFMQDPEKYFEQYATLDCFIGYELTDYNNYENNFFNYLPAFVTILREYKEGYHISLYGNTKMGRHGTDLII